jgi:hypothetical protein
MIAIRSILIHSKLIQANSQDSSYPTRFGRMANSLEELDVALDELIVKELDQEKIRKWSGLHSVL